MADKKITIKQYTGTGTNYDTLYPATTATQISYSDSNVQAVVDELYTSVKDGKTQIATAISDKGQITYPSDTFATMTANVRNIQTFKPEQDKTAYANGWIYPDEGKVLSSVSVAIPVYDGSIVVPYPTDTFNNTDWTTIKKIAKAGTGPSLWNVGDRKEVILNGTVGNKSFSNTTTYCDILGFDHNTSIESNGEHTIHIGFGAESLTGDKYIAYVDSNYGPRGSFNMNTSNTNSGGWNSCQMKSTICPAFKNALPAELKSNIRAVTKWQNNGHSTSGQSSSNEIWLLSEMEIFGSADKSGYTANQVQYDFYKGVTGWSAASKIKYNDTSTSRAVSWWERSAASIYSGDFCRVYEDGTAHTNNADVSNGFAPCLCL